MTTHPLRPLAPILAALLTMGFVSATQAKGGELQDMPRSPVPSSAAADLYGALFIDIPIAGWQTFSGFGSPLNSEFFINLPPATSVTGFEFINLSITTAGASWGEELVLSVNNSEGTEWMDWAPFGGAGGQPGSFGPVNSTWNGPVGSPPIDFFTGEPIPGAEGAPFSVLPDGVLWVTVYESFNDAGDGLDATINTGTLRVFVTAIPEPSTYGLMALGLLGVAVAAARRRQG